MACNCTKIIEMQVENEKLMKTMEGVISKLKKENEKLKREYELCSCKSNSTEYEISGWIDCDCSWCKTVCSPELIKFLDKKYKIINQLEEENTKLKTQLQNSDKPSQVERKPHKCPTCFGLTFVLVDNPTLGQFLNASYERCRFSLFGVIYETCKTCNGTGIVWERKL